MADDSALEIGDDAPPYLGKDPDGQKIDITDFAGKLVVVSFWATWCKPCLEELPVLENIQNHLGYDKVKVVAVNFKEDRRQFKRVSKRLSELKLTLTHDGRGFIGKKYGVTVIPHLFLVDKTGKLAFQQRGYGDAALEKLVDALNEQLAP